MVAASILCAAAGAATIQSASVAFGHPILAARWSLLWQLAAWAGCWVIGTAAALRVPLRWALPLIFTAAIAVRVAALAGPPTTSDDLYRYSWDARVQAAGIDPYAEPPSSPKLARLRVPWLFPGPAECAALHRDTGCTKINRPDVRTIYPPVAEAWFVVVNQIAGIGSRHKASQVAGLLADLVTVGLLAGGLRRTGRDPRWTALYALSPAPALEFVNNGHIDALAVTLIIAALVVAVGPAPPTAPRSESPADGARVEPPSTVWRDVAVGLLIGAAALVKIYPALLLVVVVCLPRRHRWLSAIRAAGAASALAVVSYAPHVLAVGMKVIGYLPGYLREEHYNQGGRFLLATALGFKGRAAGAISVAAVVVAVAWVLRRRPPPATAATVLMAVVLFAATPVQPWYAVSLLAVAALAGRRAAAAAAAAVVAAGYPYYFAVLLDAKKVIGIGQVSYGAAVVVAIAGLVLSRRHSPISFMRVFRTAE